MPTTDTKVYPLMIEAEVLEALREVYDPEIPVNIYDLGLIYEVNVDEYGVVDIEMTLTSPACPVAGILPGQVENKVREVPGVADVSVELVWEPAWSMDRMSEEARLELGFF
jgi:FeS assembly SUF system protein